MTVEKQFFRISEVTRMTGLPASTLRYWEKQFDCLNPRTDRHGNRFYKQADIDLIQQIRYLRDEMHITRIEAIRKELRQPSRQVDIRQRTTDILLQVRQELTALRDLLTPPADSSV